MHWISKGKKRHCIHIDKVIIGTIIGQLHDVQIDIMVNPLNQFFFLGRMRYKIKQDWPVCNRSMSMYVYMKGGFMSLWVISPKKTFRYQEFFTPALRWYVCHTRMSKARIMLLSLSSIIWASSWSHGCFRGACVMPYSCNTSTTQVLFCQRFQGAFQGE